MKKCSLLVLLMLLISAVCHRSAYANGTSYFQDSELPAGNVLPMEKGKVSIEREDLFIRLKKDGKGSILSPQSPSLAAHVVVNYQMRNQMETDVIVPIAFPQPGETDDWNITLDGKKVPLTGTVAIPRDQLIGEVPHTEWIHPRTGEMYHLFRHDRFSEFQQLESKTFTVSLRRGTTHSLQAEYDVRLGIDEQKSLHPVYRLDYLLHPASYWSGFKDLHIRLDIPFDTELHANLPLQRTSDVSWEGNFPQLPQENLVVFVSPDSGWLIDLFNSEGKALGFLLVLVLLFFLVSKLALAMVPAQKRKMALLIILIVFVWAGYDILQHKIIGYPFAFFHPMFFAIYLTILGIALRRFRR